MDSNQDEDVTTTIFIPLLNEGTSVWRPTTARLVRPGTYQVLSTSTYYSDEEEWAFPPGSLVKCETDIHDGNSVLVAKEQVAGN